MVQRDHSYPRQVLSFGEFDVDEGLRQIRRKGAVVAIEPKPFELLVYLIHHRDRVVHKDELMDILWPGVVVSESSLSSSVRRARAALEPASECIQGVRKVGYRFVGEIRVAAGGGTAAPADEEPTPSSVFVGRRGEVEQLTQALERGRGGRGAFLVIAGEPGIGKTRTIEELTRCARARGIEVLEGRCYEGDGGQAFWPWVQVFRSFAERRDAQRLDAVLGSEANDIARLTAALAGQVNALPAGDPDMLRTRLLDSVVTVLRRAARQAPLLIVLDDLHWADSASITLLQILARQVADVALVIVGAYRDVEVVAEHPLATMLGALRREGLLLRLALGGLSAAESANLVDGLAGAAVDAATLRMIFDVTEGNPFFVREYWRHLVEEGVLIESAEGWRPRPDALVHGVPESVGEIIKRRLRRLSAECVQLLTIGAVVGREFSHDVLSLVSTGTARDAIDFLDQAVGSNVLEEVRGTAGRYRFAHALIRETLYDGMTQLRRATLHRYVAESIEALAPAAKTRELLADLAHHFFEAAATGSPKKAIEYAQRAAAEATQSCAYDAAVGYLDRAVRLDKRLADSDDPDAALRSCELCLLLAEALDRAGDGPRMRSTFEQAASMARLIPAPQLLARAAIGVTSRELPEDETAIRLLEEALAVLPASEVALRARAQARLAQALYLFDGTRARREQLCAEARVTAAALGDAQTLGEVLADSLEALFHSDSLAQQDELTQALQAAAEAAGNARLRLLARTWQIASLMRRGRLNDADRHVAEFSRLASELRQPRFLYRAATFEAALLLARGHLDQAEARSMDALRLGERIDAAAAAWTNWVLLHHVRHEQGRFAEFIDEGLVLRLPPNSQGAISFRRSGRWALPHILSELGRDAEVKVAFDALMAAGLDTLPPDNSRNTRIPALFSMADACATINDEPAAEQLYALLLPYADQWHVLGLGNVVFASSQQMLGVLSGIRRRWDDANAHFEEAMRQHTSEGAACAEARTLFQHARILQRRGRRADVKRADQLIERALEIATRFGLKGIEARLLRLSKTT